MIKYKDDYYLDKPKFINMLPQPVTHFNKM